MKVSFPHFGNYDIAFEKICQLLNLDYLVPPKTTFSDIERGAKISPEMYCFPFKVNMGNYLRAIQEGADHFFMWQNPGLCRQRYYAALQEKALQDAGYQVSVVGLGPKIIFQLKKISDASFLKMIYVTCFTLRLLHLIEEIERKTRFYRPREKNSGETDRVSEECFKRLREIKNLRELFSFKRKLKKRFAKIWVKEKQNLLKVGIIGEIFTVIDGVTNYDIERKLGSMEVEITRNLSISEFIKHGLFPWTNTRAKKIAFPYLKSGVGGHGLLTVAEMLEYAEKGYDGVIHLLPFGCMPESTVRPILHKIKEEHKIPLLSLSIDEQTSDTGLETRLEAFVDLLKSRKLQR